MGRCHAGTLDWLGVDERSYGEHLTWAPGRKIDRLKYTTSSGRAEARRYLNEEIEDDMFTDEDRELLERLNSVVCSNSDTKALRPDADSTSGLRYAIQRIWNDTYGSGKHDAKMAEQMQALLDAQDGLDTAAVLARIDQRHAEAAAERDTLMERTDTLAAALDGIVGLLSQHADGTLLAEDVVRKIGEKLSSNSS
jgi:hypothetical protein